ncbi:MAG: ketoacyl-ACP synthase III [Oligoflexia bacterium]|nr:ketoacyl-ACP synthase III [Oligoflexia bacterium]
MSTHAQYGPQYASKITGTGSAFPQRVVTNEELMKTLDTNNEWILERTGIRERRISRPGDPSETNSSLACQAALRALEMAGKRPEDIDMLLFCSVSPDTPVPISSCWLQKKLGATRAWGMDLNAACSSWVYGLVTADQFIRSGYVKTALVVGSEVLSTMTNWEDRTSAILFGDAAGAAILERTSPESPHRILSSHLGMDGSYYELFSVVAGGSNMEVTPEAHAQKLDKMNMKGREIFKVAVKTLADYATKAVEAQGLKLSDIDWVIPHQANLRIIEAVAKRLDLPMDRVLVNVDRYGNTSSATTPTMLDEAVRDGRIKPGHMVLFDVFGAGLTFGSMLIRW